MNIEEIIKKMTLDEKIAYTSGDGHWYTKGIERLGVERMMCCDGPVGLRALKNVDPQKAGLLGGNQSIEAVCYPGACALASSFDTALARRMGECIGEEAQAEGIGVVLGPGVNIKRSPLGGRNFEYYSEDPYLAGEMGAAMVEGIQSQGVGACVKHFALNNQEYRRMYIDVKADERTMREIYLSVFEKIIKKAKPWAVMSAYNKVNGTYCSENKTLLTDILRKEWGFDGLVMTDWGATSNRVEGLKAGQDLEMPSSYDVFAKKVKAAVESKELNEEVLDTAVSNIMNVVFRAKENKKDISTYDKEQHHKVATEIAAQCAVLLKNEEVALPLSKDKKVAFIGEFAKKPRYQGGGSSNVNAYRIDNAFDSAKKYANILYAAGYSLEKDEVCNDLIEEACNVAKEADCAVVFAGLTEIYEAEGYDRTTLQMPEAHNALIEAVANVQKNTIVVLYNGSPVQMPWISKVKAVLEMYLGGQGVGEATAMCLFGQCNPSGKLPESFPLCIEDTSAYLNFPGDKKEVDYAEGVFVGYRYYDKKNTPLLFPFGHGLSYTDFEYKNLKLSKSSMTQKDTIRMTATIRNTGACAGAEVVQLYVHNPEDYAIHPKKELKGFVKVFLNPEEEKEIHFDLDERAFSHYLDGEWKLSEGRYKVSIASSSRDIRLTEDILVHAESKRNAEITIDTLVEDLMEDQEVWPVFEKFILGSAMQIDEDDASMSPAKRKMMLEIVKNMPLRGMAIFNGSVTIEEIEALIDGLKRTK